jgi:tetratricopeptide (TPR) repeat protein
MPWSRTKLILLRVALGVVGLPLALCGQPISGQMPIRPCRSVSDCNRRGTAVLKAKNIKAAIDAFTEQLRDAEEIDETEAAHATRISAIVLAFNNLTVAHIHQGEFLRARAWAEEALDLSPENPAAVHNMATIDANLRSFKWPASPNGAYFNYIGCGDWNEIRISEASASLARISFEGIRFRPDGCHTFPGATGELEGQIVLRGKVAVYENASCKIQLEFEDDGLSVEEEGQCGFGSGVHASGDYRRISVR